jgi:hypothetical protein
METGKPDSPSIASGVDRQRTLRSKPVGSLRCAASALTLFGELIGHPLRCIRVFDPWTEATVGTGVASIRKFPLYGGITFDFGKVALVFLSPLRYMRHQGGTTVFDALTNQSVPLGYRVHACKEWDQQLFQQLVIEGMPVAQASHPNWMDASKEFVMIGKALVDARIVRNTSPAIANRSTALPTLELRFDNGRSLWLTYREDLDGSIQAAEPGWNHRIVCIEPTEHGHAFGWLLDDAPYPLLIDGRRWTHVADYVNGFLEDRGIRNNKAAQAYERQRRREYAVRLKFVHYPQLARRLKAVQYPGRYDVA